MDLQLVRSLPIASAEGGEHAGPNFYGLVFYVVLVLVIIAILIAQARKGMNQRVFKNPITQAAEQMYLFVEGLCLNIIGSHGRKYIPFIGTIWLMIFIGNSVALFFPTSPTADFSFNLSMALIAIAYVQHEGIKGHADHLRHEGKGVFEAWFIGFFRHMSHFAGPRLPVAMAVIITPLIFVVEIISELMKNVSLSLRLFGNMHGGHAAVEALNNITPYFPLGGFLLLVKLLTVIVQALVFSLLTCVYISLVTHHDEPAGEHAHAH